MFRRKTLVKEICPNLRTVRQPPQYLVGNIDVIFKTETGVNRLTL